MVSNKVHSDRLSAADSSDRKHFAISNRQKRKDLAIEAEQALQNRGSRAFSESHEESDPLFAQVDHEELAQALESNPDHVFVQHPEEPASEENQQVEQPPAEQVGKVESGDQIKKEQASIAQKTVLEDKGIDNSNTAKKTAGVNSLGRDTILLIICANRPEYLSKTLQHVLQYHPRESVPIVVSQDGNNPTVTDAINQAKEQFESFSSLPFTHIQHVNSNNMRYENGYFKLADHFKFALNKVFSEDIKANRVIILEEDLQIAPDFFEFFAATAPLLDNDPQLLAVSAWNDNGFEGAVRDNKMIYRSDFFPGLGWMLTKKLWTELAPKWPRAYWDDWLREPKQRQNRHILRPEISRTLHFGIHGVSNAQYSDFLQAIKLNDDPIPFTQMDLTHLSTVEKWDAYYLSQVRRAKAVSLSEAKTLFQMNGERITDLRISYNSIDESSFAPDSYTTLARWTGAMNNVKAGVPRTAYKGVVTIYKGSYRIHLVPKDFA